MIFKFRPAHRFLRDVFGIALAAMFCLSDACAQSDQTGLLAWWKFDEGNGHVVRDASGNGHNGSVNNPDWVEGKINHALNFERGGFVEIPDHKELQLDRDFTITGWIQKTKPSIQGRSMGIVSKSSKDAWDYDLFMSTSRLEHPAFYSDVFKIPGGDIEVISDEPVTLDQWQHVAVTRKGPMAKIYLNGNVTGTATLPERLATSSKSLFIGYDHDGGFSGAIDDIRIYDRALDAEEIRRVMDPHVSNDLVFKHTVIDSAFGGIRAVAKIDADQFPDIVHCFWYKSAPLAWYEYRHPGRWEKHIIRENFYPVTDNFDVGDVDGDDDIDIIIAQSPAKRSNDPKADNIGIDKVEIVWFENPRPSQDAENFAWKEHTIGFHVDSHENYVKDIRSADFTGDGKPEVIVRSNVAVSIFHRETAGRWKQIHYFKVRQHEGMDMGDVDCDGDPDIVLNGFWLECPTDPLNGKWSQRVIDAKWFSQTGDWTANNCKVYVKDMNHDGCPDVLLAHSERAGYPVSWYEADKIAKGSWIEHVIGEVDFCHTLQAADMDLDGDVDVVVGEMEKSGDPDQIIVFLNNGDGLTWKKEVISNTGIYSGKVADIGNDGDPDLVANRNFDKPPLELWENLIRPGKFPMDQR